MEFVQLCKQSCFCRNVSSDGAEARQRLRECEGLVAALLHALQSAVVNKDTDNKVAAVTTLISSLRINKNLYVASNDDNYFSKLQRNVTMLKIVTS